MDLCMKFALALFATLIFSSATTSADEHSRPPSVPDSEKLDSWLLQENRTYEAWFVDRQSVHFKDPYIWVYTESFAKDFRMPSQWIDR